MKLCEFSVIIYFELFDPSTFLYNSPVYALLKIHRHMLCHISFVLSISRENSGSLAEKRLAYLEMIDVRRE